MVEMHESDHLTWIRECGHKNEQRVLHQGARIRVTLE